MDYAITQLTTTARASIAASRRRILAFNDRPSSSPLDGNRRINNSDIKIAMIEAEKILDAPGLKDVTDANLMDWGCADALATAVDRTIHLLLFGNSSFIITSHNTIEAGGDVNSIKWAPDGIHLAIGFANSIELWDVGHGRLVRTLKDVHSSGSRVGPMSWNGNILTSGASDGSIVVNDPRLRPSSVVCSYRRETGKEISALSWSTAGRHLASGCSDGLVHVWDARSQRSWHPWLYRFTDHVSGAGGVRALAWCPFNESLLASGATDETGCIKFWSSNTGVCVNTLHTASGPVLALVWSKNDHRLVSSCASFYTEDLISIWDYPSMSRTSRLVGHTSMVLYIAQSPDGCRIASAVGGEDETVRLWNVFRPSPKEDEATTRPFDSSYRSQIRTILNMLL